jgi:hypothetical protein
MPLPTLGVICCHTEHAVVCICRFPQNINLFSAMIGAGTQIFVVVLCVFLLSLVGTFYPYNRGAMLSACVVLYALTAGISGGCWPWLHVYCLLLNVASSSCTCLAAMCPLNA